MGELVALLNTNWGLEYVDSTVIIIYWIAELSAKMSGSAKSTGSKSAGTHPSYAVMIQQGLTAMVC